MPAEEGQDGRGGPDGGRTPERAAVRDRHVVLVATAVVVVVLGLRLLSDYVPGVDAVLGLAPVVIAALAVVTLVVLFRALRPPRRPAP